ncbi:hypothetical protein Bhyg_02912, partial [Pseudolycoriella hygida]
MSEKMEKFLRDLGFDSDVVQRFSEHKITLSILPHLTTAHINELPPSIGDRIAFSQALQNLPSTSSHDANDDTTTVAGDNANGSIPKQN